MGVSGDEAPTEFLSTMEIAVVELEVGREEGRYLRCVCRKLTLFFFRCFFSAQGKADHEVDTLQLEL